MSTLNIKYNIQGIKQDATVLFFTVTLHLDAIDKFKLRVKSRENMQISAWMGKKIFCEIYENDKFIKSFSGVIEKVKKKKNVDLVYIYTICFFPAFSELLNNVKSRYFMDIDLHSMLQKIFQEYPKLDYLLDFDKRHKINPFVSQLEETDMQFFCRLLQSHGVHFCVDYSNRAEKLVIADKHNFFGKCYYRNEETGNVLRSFEPSFHVLDNEQTQVDDTCGPIEKVYGCPSFNGDNTGFNTLLNPIIKRDARYKTGLSYELPSERFKGIGDLKQLQAGQVIALSGHLYEELNRRFLVYKVKHDFWLKKASCGEVTYKTTCYCVKDKAVVNFPSKRKNRVNGVLSGNIKLDDTDYVIDKNGSYRLVFPYARNGAQNNNKFPRAPLVKQYGGSHNTSHFNLDETSPILIDFIDGDANLPVIIGTIANATYSSSVAGADAKGIMIQPKSGCYIKMSDHENNFLSFRNKSTRIDLVEPGRHIQNMDTEQGGVSIVTKYKAAEIRDMNILVACGAVSMVTLGHGAEIAAGTHVLFAGSYLLNAATLETEIRGLKMIACNWLFSFDFIKDVCVRNKETTAIVKQDASLQYHMLRDESYFSSASSSTITSGPYTVYTDKSLQSSLYCEEVSNDSVFCSESSQEEVENVLSQQGSLTSRSDLGVKNGKVAFRKSQDMQDSVTTKFFS